MAHRGFGLADDVHNTDEGAAAKWTASSTGHISPSAPQCVGARRAKASMTTLNEYRIRYSIHAQVAGFVQPFSGLLFSKAEARRDTWCCWHRAWFQSLLFYSYRIAIITATCGLRNGKDVLHLLFGVVSLKDMIGDSF